MATSTSTVTCLSQNEWVHQIQGVPPITSAGVTVATSYVPVILDAAGQDDVALSVTTSGVTTTYTPIGGEMIALNIPSLVVSGTGVTPGELGALAVANNLSDVANAATALANIGGAPRLVDTGTVHTASYTMHAQDAARFNVSGGSVTQPLPTAPANGTLVYLKLVVAPAGHTLTYTCGGSDVLNVASGATSGTLSLLWQGVLLQYSSSGAIWMVQADDLALSQLDARYQAIGAYLASPTTAGALGVAASEVGAASGVASLNSSGQVPIGQLPITTTTLTYTGAGVPSNSLGQNGDSYIDSVTENIYTNTSGTWSLTRYGNGVLPACDLVATTNITLSGLQTVDGTSTGALRVVCVNQTTASQNGPWLANTSGAWSRPADYATGSLVAGRTVQIVSGTVWATSGFQLAASPSSPITVDTTATTWNVLNAPVISLTSTTTLTLPAGSYRAVLVGGGGSGGGGGAAAYTSGTATQVGGAGGGQGQWLQSTFTLTTPTSFTGTIGGGGAAKSGGAASTGSTGNAGTAGAGGGNTTLVGGSVSLSSTGGSGGGAGGANSAGTVNAGVYGLAAGTVNFIYLPGCGGLAENSAGFGPGAPIGVAASAVSGGGAPASATYGGVGGGAGYITSLTGTSAGGTGTSAAANSGGGGAGGGGGSGVGTGGTGGAGGTSGAGGSGYITLTVI